MHLLLVFSACTSVISQEKGRERLSTLHRDAEKNLLTVILQYQQEECFYQYTHVNTMLKCTFQVGLSNVLTFHYVILISIFMFFISVHPAAST